MDDDSSGHFVTYQNLKARNSRNCKFRNSSINCHACYTLAIQHIKRPLPHAFNNQASRQHNNNSMNTLPVTNQDTLHHGRHAAEPAQYGVYDKPADRRLAPWITIGSIILMVCATIPSHLPFFSLEHIYPSSTSSFHHTVVTSSLNNLISNATL